MEITVNRANKFLQQINSNLGSSRTEIGSGVVFYYTVTGADNPGKVSSKFEEERTRFKKSLEATTDLFSDYYNLKSIVFDYNVKSGLNKILNEIDKTNFELSLWKGILHNIQRSRKDTQEDTSLKHISDSIDILRASESVNLIYFSEKFISEEEAEQKVIDFQAKLLKLDDEKVKLNAGAINIEFSVTTKKLLGLV